tara:strand:- start:46 stop:183 length:138 start_codon:yes stop_codon:yes gene_type:complete
LGKALLLMSSPPVKVPKEGNIILFFVTTKQAALILMPLNFVFTIG